MRFIVLAGALFVALTQSAALKIVVIQGEDAVNIIQQKTSVAPIVEIRDRNDLPVSGVPVTFTVAGPNATLGSGLQTVTVTTNAAGRAAVASLTPVSPGAVQINVSASAQGQTATATITQTNFATAAAATAAGATVAGAAAGAAAGGGLGAAAIIGIVGGGAAAAGVGLKAVGGGGGDDGGDDGGGGGPGGPTACTSYTVEPTSFNVASDQGFVQVQVTASPPNCANTATATSNAAFLTVTGGSMLAGPVSISIARNEAGNPARSGTVTIAGTTVTINQNARCVFAAAPTQITIPPTGGSAQITISVAPNGCDNDAWRVTVGVADEGKFILNPQTGAGNGILTVTMTPTSQQRGGAISINGVLVSVLQPAPSTPGGQ